MNSKGEDATVADPKRQLQGSQAKAKGAAFEARIEKSFAYYRAKGLAVITKEAEPMHPIKNLGNGKFIAYYESKSKPDYSGCIKGGRMVCFEAKYTDALKISYDRVKEHQARYMSEVQEYGVRCFVLCGFRSGDAYRVPWYIWQRMKELYGRKYVVEDDLAKYKVPVGKDGTLFLLDDAR